VRLTDLDIYRARQARRERQQAILLEALRALRVI
jgi:hypothetical protein